MNMPNSSANLPGSYAQTPPPVKKKSGCGCGCFLSGCLFLILLIVLPIVGGGIYISSLNDEEWGDKVVWLIKNPSFSKGFKNGIQESAELTPDEKKAFTQMYDELLENYDRLTPEQQSKVKKDLVIVFKAFLKNPDMKAPPPELMDLMQVLQPGMLDMTAPPEITTNPPVTPAPQTPPQTTTPPPSNNPYDFGTVPSTSTPQPTPPVQPTQNPNENFDF